MGFPMTITVSIKNIGTGDGTFDVLAYYAERRQTYYWLNTFVEKGATKALSVGNIQPAKEGQNSIYANMQLVKPTGNVFMDEKTLIFQVGAGTASAATVEALKRRKSLYQGNRFNVKPKWR